MPVYEYGCEACGTIVEALHGIDVPGPERCERCGGRLRKRLSTPAIVFRGSGWAKKDARAASGVRSGPGTKDGSAKGASEDAGDSSATGGAATRDGEAAEGARAGSGTKAAGAPTSSESTTAASKDSGSTAKPGD